MSKSLFKSTSVVVAMTMISRVFGFIRDMVTAQFFGAGAGFDAFSVAFRIPNLLRRLFAEGSFSQAFVPILAEYQKKHTQEELKQFINAIAGTQGFVLLVVTIAGMVLSPWIVHLFVPGFNVHDERYALAVTMLRVTFPYLFFISLTAFSGAILNTYSRFWVAAVTPVFLNLCLIGAAIWLAPHMRVPITALAWGILLAGIVQLFFQLPFLKNINLLPRPLIQFRNPGVKRVLKMMGPAVFGVSVGQINLFLDSVFASFLIVGSMSWLYFSDRLMEFPLGVFGVAISTVILPNLSRHNATQSAEDFSLTIDWALRCVLLIGMPAAVVLGVMAGPLLSTLLQHGKFDSYAVSMAQKSLAMFAVGITPFMLVKVLASGFYAKQDMRTPVKIGVVAMVSNAIFNLILIWPLKHAGIALATSLSAVLNAGCLYYFLLNKKFYTPREGWGFFSLRLFFANAVLGVFLWEGVGNMQEWLNNGWQWRCVRLAILLISAIIVYFVSLWLAGVRPKDVLIPHHASA